jgi:hypothetical protein
LIPSTARTDPSSVSNSTHKSRIDKSGADGVSADTENAGWTGFSQRSGWAGYLVLCFS